MKKILFLFNPYSGKCKIKENLVDILKIFSKYEYQIEVYPTKAPLDGKRYLMSNGKYYDLIVCSGGDGTLNEIVSAIVETKLDIPLGYIPSGSTNDFGNSIGLSNNMIECADIIMTKDVEIKNNEKALSILV
ncbi:MAG: acylglycerol kinase family protein [Fusobacteriaceae bacterium]|jgi:diacylglycerol kinase family enzyme|nr:acylglycerol kinase family protein [Fusobacteriaceae bacterium]